MMKAFFYFSGIFILFNPLPFLLYAARGDMNLTPIAAIYGLHANVSLRNIVGNILFFMPLGFGILST